MTKVTIDSRKASKRDCVRMIGALQEENGKLKAKVGRMDFYIGKRLGEWPYNWVNKLWPFFPPRPVIKPAQKVEVPNV